MSIGKEKQFGINHTIAVTDTCRAVIPFIKADRVNPVLLPETTTFNCPILKQMVPFKGRYALYNGTALENLRGYT